MAPQPAQDNNKLTQVTWLVALAAVMMVTRGSLFDGVVPVQLHDASWAAFVLAGAILRRPIYLVALAALALGLDLVSLCVDSGSLASCLRPSYPVLMGSWILLFGAGLMMRLNAGTSSLPRNLLLAAVAVSVTYGLTSGGFYLWSGFYAEWSIAEFWNMSAPHFLMALGTSLAYILAGLLVHALLGRAGDDVTASA